MSNLIPTDGEAMSASRYGRCPAGSVERSESWQEGMPKSQVLTFPAGAVDTAPQKARERAEAVLTALIADMVALSSVVASLVEDRIRDTGKGPLTIGLRDARDIQFIAGQAAAYADRVRQAWEAI